MVCYSSKPGRQSAEQGAATRSHTGPMEEPAVIPHSTGHAGRFSNPPSTHLTHPILPTHPEGVTTVLPQLAAWLISANASKTKKFLVHHSCQPCFVAKWLGCSVTVGVRVKARARKWNFSLLFLSVLKCDNFVLLSWHSVDVM